jgi:hypothetical protein
MIELLFAEAPCAINDFLQDTAPIVGSMVPQGTEPGARIEAMNEM